MSMTFFMWAVLLMLAYIAFMVTNHSNTGDKQAVFLADKISGLKYELESLKNKQGKTSDYSDKHYDRLCDRFNDVQSTVNKIKEMGEANHRWIIANHTLISTSYRLIMAVDRRTHCMDLDLSMSLSGYTENWCSDEEWYECNNIIRENGFIEANEFIKKVNEE